MELNSITDEGANSLIEFYNDMLVKAKQPQDRYEAYFNLGLVAWRAGDVAKLNSNLKLAAEQVLEAIEQRDIANVDTPRTPDTAVLPFFVVMNFGDDQQRQRLKSIKRQQFFQPEDNRYKSLADLLDVLRCYFAGKKLSGVELESITNANEHEDADNFYEPLVGNLTLGLEAVVEQNALLAEKCLNYLVQSHTRLAKGGGWEKLAEGLLSFWALTLANVAKKEGVLLKVESPYLPRQ